MFSAERNFIFIVLLVYIGLSLAETASLNTTGCCKTCHPKILNVPKYKIVYVPNHKPYPVLRPITVETTKKCEKGYTKKGNKCIRIVKSTTTCPAGFYRISDTECEHVLILVVVDPPEPKPLICPKGFTRVGKYRCIKILSCPKGFKKNIDGKCVLKKKSCPENFVRYGSACIQITKCPRGFILRNNKCVKVKNCPNGFIKIDETCQKEGDCPKGFKKDSSCVCVKTLTECPLGTKILKNGKCEKKSLECPVGYVFIPRQEKCEKLIGDLCPKDFVLRDDKCIKITVKTPFGYSFGDDGKCYKNPCKCLNVFEPVCGIDGITYKNECEARCLKAIVHHQSSCPSKCIKKCSQYLKPVCGADGVTYQNACYARTSGIEVISKGECSLCHK